MIAPASPSKPTADAATHAASAGRLLSLDVLRGFDMFWIVGAEWLVKALGKLTDNPVTRLLTAQMSHSAWEGFTFYDLIFPLFIFIVGVSTVLSLTRSVARIGRSRTLVRVLSRSVLLFVVGLLYYGGLSQPLSEMRVLGVLQRIALCYLFGSLLFLYLKPRALVGTTLALLVGYWALLTFVPIRNVTFPAVGRKQDASKIVAQTRAKFEATTETVTGKYERGLNLASHVDFRVLPGRPYYAFWDPEGVLSTLPAIATALMGILAGLLLARTDLDDRQKLLWLAGAGAAAITLGALWGLQFPVIKRIWTSSYALIAGGASALLLAGFYWVVDVRRIRGWCGPFVWIGMNPIAIYLTDNVVDFEKVATRIAGGNVAQALNTHVAHGAGELAIALVATGLVVGFARFLYSRQIFLRL